MANRIVCGDTIYEMTPAYIAGAKAMRSNTPYWANPHRQSSKSHDQWNYGHNNEATGEHFRFGTDLLEKTPLNETFEDDPRVPRGEDGDIDMEWYVSMLARSEQEPAPGTAPEEAAERSGVEKEARLETENGQLRSALQKAMKDIGAAMEALHYEGSMGTAMRLERIGGDIEAALAAAPAQEKSEDLTGMVTNRGDAHTP